VVALRQLTTMGMSASGVRRRVAMGSVHPVHRAVYSVGHPLLSSLGRDMAAVLACGPGAVLSHRSAAALWNLRGTSRSAIDVTRPRKGVRSRDGIDLHASAGLTAADVTTVDRIPCTTVARTLLDLAEVVPRRALERACEQAEVLRVFDGRKVDDTLRRATGRRGAAILRAVLATMQPGQTITRNDFEERLLALCDAEGLPRPGANAWVEGYEVDFLWDRERLIVETDGFAVHGTRQAFGRDRRRDQRLAAAGFTVIRCTWDQIDAELAQTIRSLLLRSASAEAAA
jgi:hypothetical protein